MMPLMGPGHPAFGEGPEVWNVQYSNTRELGVALEKINATFHLQAEPDSLPDEEMYIIVKVTEDISIDFFRGALLVIFGGTLWHFKYDPTTREPSLWQAVVFR